MEHVQKIEKAVSKLSKLDLIDFRNWYEKFDQKAWDDQFEDDAKSGKLNALADQAVADFKAGRCKEI
ncbi:MAG: hypothetical protein U9Q05_00345 [Thermodesulfobacteriota bacterium]|nr:hypothetical protein [Thermodesulfobacteriota bacterium]